MKRTPLGYALFALILMLIGIAIGYTGDHPTIHGITLLVSIVFMIWFMNKVEPRRFELAGRKKGVAVHQEMVVIPSSNLLIAQAERREASDPVLSVSTQMTAFIEVLITDLGQTVKSIRLEGNANGKPAGRETRKICVSGGTLFLGDRDFADRLWKTRELNDETLKMLEPDAPQPYALFRDNSAVTGLVVSTGEGNDWYDLEMEVKEKDTCVLFIRFLGDEESSPLTNAKG